MSEEQPSPLRERILAQLGSELNCAYDCTRVWEAWSVGTMDQDDFVPVDHRINEITDGVMDVIAIPSFAVPKALEEQACVVALKGSEVTIDCDENADAIELFGWLTEIGGITPKAEAPDAQALASALEKALNVIRMFKDPALLGEGVHTGLRKGTDARDANELWSAISRSKTSAWGDAIAFALDPYFSMWGGNEALKAGDEALDAFRQQSKDDIA